MSFEQRFRVLARERLVTIRGHLDAIARGATDGELDAELRREIHTMKGEARIVGLGDIADVLHGLEEALEQGEAAAAIVARLDAIEGLLEDDGGTDEAGSAPGDGLIERVARSAGDALLRVDVASLSRIARTIGELRVGEAELQRTVDDLEEIADKARRGDEDPGARARTASDLRHMVVRLRQLAFDQHVRLDQLVGHVREVRMVPLATLFERFPRAAAQLAEELGKAIRVEVRGADVLVDRQVLDVIAEPMLHLVRNAVDHGLEPPDVRIERGKDPEGTLELAAVVDGSLVRIDVRDDGGGVDLGALREAVRARGEGEHDVATMGEDEVLDLLCMRGLSTRRIVTDVSGRGVGLDVVKRRVESVGGRLALRTIVGGGSTFSIEVPMSALLAPMLCVLADDARYVLAPQDVVLLVELAGAAIEPVGRGLALRVEGAPVPFFDLSTLLGTARRDPRERPTAMIVSHGARRLAVAVDRVLGTVPVLQQRLDAFLEGASLVRSVALLTTGEIAVALDVGEIFRRADAGRSGGGGSAESERAAVRAKRVLVADDSELTRDVVVSVLREMGLEVIEAVDGRSALELIASKKPDLVLTDLDMPIVDGFELLRRVRAEPAWASLPMIVLSTRWAPVDLQRASELGADAYLVKNRIELEEVRRVIDAHLTSGRDVSGQDTGRG